MDIQTPTHHSALQKKRIVETKTEYFRDRFQDFFGTNFFRYGSNTKQAPKARRCDSYLQSETINH